MGVTGGENTPVIYTIGTGFNVEGGGNVLFLNGLSDPTIIANFITVGIDSQVDIAFKEGNSRNESKMVDMVDAINQVIQVSINVDGTKQLKMNTFNGTFGALVVDELLATTGTIEFQIRNGGIIKAG